VVTVRFIIIGASSESILADFEVDGRIAGVKEIDVVSSSGQPASRLLPVVTSILGAVLAMLSSLFTETARRWPSALRRRFSRTLSPQPGSSADLVICAATYGAQDKTNDVSQILTSKVRGGKLELLVSNDNLGGDPIPGVGKKLQVEYIHSGKRHSATVNERKTLVLP